MQISRPLIRLRTFFLELKTNLVSRKVSYEKYPDVYLTVNQSINED